MPDALSQAAETEPRRDPMDLASAISLLDPENPEHWTADGKPKMAVLEDLTNGNLTRAEVEDTFPGFTRDTARAKDQQQADAEALTSAAPQPESAMVATAPMGSAGFVGAFVNDREGETPQEYTRRLEDRVAFLEAELAFLRKTFGWPTKE